MRILVFSDLHLECGPFEPPETEVDAIVLAGDIDVGLNGLSWAEEQFGERPCLYLAGNHEYYDCELPGTLRRYREEALARGIIFLDNDVAVIGDLRFLGATLWSDFRLFGADQQTKAMAGAQAGVSDFIHIRVRGTDTWRFLEPGDVLQWHESARSFLAAELAKPFRGKTVVATHFAPSSQSIAPKFAYHPLSAYFASSLEDLIVAHEPALWIHGHTHGSCDYRIGRTRVVCNPRGYHPHALNPNFNPGLVIEL